VCSCDFVEDEYATVGFGLCRSGESNLRSDEMEMISCKGIKKSGASPGSIYTRKEVLAIAAGGGDCGAGKYLLSAEVLPILRSLPGMP
jgi:hypothetical protein